MINRRFMSKLYVLVLVSSRGTTVIALVDYNPIQNELLAFSKGDVGRLIKQDEGGWCFIELKGIEGWVPKIYWAEHKVYGTFCLLHKRFVNSEKFWTADGNRVCTFLNSSEPL